MVLLLSKAVMRFRSRIELIAASGSKLIHRYFKYILFENAILGLHFLLHLYNIFGG